MTLLTIIFSTYTSTFADQYLDKLDHNQLNQYDQLINEPSNDWDIYYWITGAEEVPANYQNNVMDMLQYHARNVLREERYYQPALKHKT